MCGSCKAFWSSIVTLHPCSRSMKRLTFTTTIRSSCCSLQAVWKRHLTLWWWQLFTWIVGSDTRNFPGQRADQATKKANTLVKIILLHPYATYATARIFFFGWAPTKYWILGAQETYAWPEPLGSAAAPYFDPWAHLDPQGFAAAGSWSSGQQSRFKSSDI